MTPLTARERGPVRVLLVEDDVDHRLLLTRRLEDSGIDVTAVGTAGEALDSLDGVDLVLLDYRLPDMTGLETMNAIHERGGPSVVMVTAMGSESVAVNAMRAGAIDYVVKDATYLETIPEVVERAWRHHDLQRRAGKLQELILLVSQADDREAIFSAIVMGAKELLRAANCGLILIEDTGPVVAAATDRDVEYTRSLIDTAAEVATSGTPQQMEYALVVPLSRDADAGSGALVTILNDPHPYSEGDVELAQTFASFAGLAVRKLRRHEIERDLISKLQETLEMRRQFVNSISHELRTPLACISGFSTTLLTYWERLDAESMRSSVEKIQRHSEDLTTLVDALLDFGTVEHGRFRAEISPLDLRPEVEAIIEGYGPLFGDHQVEVDVPQVKVMADGELLRRILVNLFSNSVKASEPASTIRVTGRAEDGVVRLEVADEGHGLTPEEKTRVFEPFWRTARSVKAAHRGTGIGLALVREYVRSMGGDIGVDSEPGKGARFFFHLPLVD